MHYYTRAGCCTSNSMALSRKSKCDPPGTIFLARLPNMRNLSAVKTWSRYVHNLLNCPCTDKPTRRTLWRERIPLTMAKQCWWNPESGPENLPSRVLIIVPNFVTLHLWEYSGVPNFCPLQPCLLDGGVVVPKNIARSSPQRIFLCPRCVAVSQVEQCWQQWGGGAGLVVLPWVGLLVNQ